MQNNNLKLQKRQPVNVQIYILAFIAALIIFFLGFLFNDYLNDKRFLEIDRIKRNFQIQILSMETQLAHFEKILCPDIGDDILTHELHIIGEKLEFMAENLGRDHPEVLHLKKYYSLLQIRHYHFSQKLCERCDLGLVHILYFFADEKYCPDCEKQGAILTYLRRKHPKLRIYSFDYHLDLLALSALKPLRPEPILEINTKSKQGSKLKFDANLDTELDVELDTEPLIQEYNLPVIVIEDKVFWGFKNLEEMTYILTPKLSN